MDEYGIEKSLAQAASVSNLATDTDVFLDNAVNVVAPGLMERYSVTRSQALNAAIKYPNDPVKYFADYGIAISSRGVSGLPNEIYSPIIKKAIEDGNYELGKDLTGDNLKALDTAKGLLSPEDKARFGPQYPRPITPTFILLPLKNLI